MTDSEGYIVYTPVEYCEQYVDAKKNGQRYPSYFAKKYISLNEPYAGIYRATESLSSAVRLYASNKGLATINSLRSMAEIQIRRDAYRDLTDYCKEQGSLTLKARMDDYEAQVIGLYNHITEVEALHITSDFFIHLSDTESNDCANMADNADNMSTYCGA